MPVTQITATIPAGQSLSQGVDASNALQLFIAMPAEWSSRAQVTFQYSPDAGVTWFDAFDVNGTELSIPLVRNGAMQLSGEIATKGWIKIRSGTRRWPVLQEANRVFNLTVVT